VVTTHRATRKLKKNETFPCEGLRRHPGGDKVYADTGNPEGKG